MADGEAWLDALGEELRRSGKIIPALAAAQAKLAEANVSDVDELQQEAAAWYSAITSAARAVLGARLSRAAPVMANAVAWASYQSPLADERQEVTLMTASLRAAQQCHRLASRLEVNPPTHSLDVVILVWRVMPGTRR